VGRLARRLLLAAILTAPAAFALLVAELVGDVPWPWMLAAIAMTMLGAFAFVAVLLGDLARFATHLDQLARGAEPPAPEFVTPVAREDLAIAVRQFERTATALRAERGALAGAGQQVVEGLPDPLVMFDEKGRVVRANGAAREVLGGTARGTSMPEVIRNPQVLEAAGRVLAGGADEEVEFTLAGATPLTFAAGIRRLAQPAADGTVLLILLHDLTRVRQIEQMRADFVANASHELRTPLATLIGFIETLDGPARDDPEARSRFLAIMADQANRMTRLVNDLLSLSEIELREHTRPEARVDLRGLLEEVIDALAITAENANVTLQLSAGHDLPPVIGERDELFKLFQNLVDNAIKYGGGDSGVEITARLHTGRTPRLRDGDVVVAVEIRDHGPGIPAEHLPRLTERFYRVDTARSRALGGTGLGLAIVKHIVNRHRGVMEIDSTPGEGTRFTVYLPGRTAG
jgi:two-component system phosphate regulon sensor histidine kinase PhoR